MKIVWALYGLKTSGAAWRNMLAGTIWEMGFIPTKADPDVEWHRASKPNGFEYYKLLLVYVNNILALSHQPKLLIDYLNKIYEVKAESIGEPKLYLGANLGKFIIPGDPSGQEYWSMSVDDYVKE